MADDSSEPTEDATTDAITDPIADVTTDAVTGDWKVQGELDVPDATGVVGRNTATTGRGTGVVGEANSPEAGTSGVRGTAWASSGVTYGMIAETRSTWSNAAALLASAPDGARALTAGANAGTGGWVYTNEPGSTGLVGSNEAQTGAGYGVHGYTRERGDGATGVKGTTHATTGAQIGVLGEVNSGANASKGVYGHDQDATSGATYGVYGQSFSNNAAAAGVVGDSRGGGAAIRAQGRVDVDDVGVSAYLGFFQTIDPDTETTVAYDTLVDNRDDFGGFDDQTGEYTVGPDGDYHVSAAVEWVPQLDGGTIHEISIDVDGTSRAYRYNQVAGPSSSASFVTEHISKTLYGLGSGAVISIGVRQKTDGQIDLAPDQQSTYLTIDKVG